MESGTGEAGSYQISPQRGGGLPAVVDFKGLIEPLRNLFKDEVRELGSELGLADYPRMASTIPGPWPCYSRNGRNHERQTRHLA